MYKATNLMYKVTIPMYKATNPMYKATNPMYQHSCPICSTVGHTDFPFNQECTKQTNPMYKATNPMYKATNPMYKATSREVTQSHPTLQTTEEREAEGKQREVKKKKKKKKKKVPSPKSTTPANMIFPATTEPRVTPEQQQWRYECCATRDGYWCRCSLSNALRDQHSRPICSTVGHTDFTFNQECTMQQIPHTKQHPMYKATNPITKQQIPPGHPKPTNNRRKKKKGGGGRGRGRKRRGNSDK